MVAVGLFGNKIVDIGDATGRFDLFHGGISFGVTQVVQDGAVEKVRLLSHHADTLAQVFEIKVTDIHTGNGHTAAQYIVQSGDHIDHGGFTGTGGAYDGIHLASGDGEVNISQQGLGRVIAKYHMLVLDGLHNYIWFLTIFGRYDGILSIEVIENTSKQCQGSCEIHLQIQQRLYGTV